MECVPAGAFGPERDLLLCAAVQRCSQRHRDAQRACATLSNPDTLLGSFTFLCIICRGGVTAAKLQLALNPQTSMVALITRGHHARPFDCAQRLHGGLADPVYPQCPAWLPIQRRRPVNTNAIMSLLPWKRSQLHTVAQSPSTFSSLLSSRPLSSPSQPRCLLSSGWLESSEGFSLTSYLSPSKGALVSSLACSGHHSRADV